jgi:hypothetical protein
MSGPVLDWLVAGDPAIRWQAERDLLDRVPAIWEETRTRVGLTGWGRRLLDLQDAGGTWGGGLYSPKWISTTYTLLLLRRLGLAPSNDKAIAGCERLLDDADWVEGGVSYWSGRSLAERCVNGMVLSLVSYFDVHDPRVGSIAELLTRRSTPPFRCSRGSPSGGGGLAPVMPTSPSDAARISCSTTGCTGRTTRAK